MFFRTKYLDSYRTEKLAIRSYSHYDCSKTIFFSFYLSFYLYSSCLNVSKGEFHRWETLHPAPFPEPGLKLKGQSAENHKKEQLLKRAIVSLQ
jgi:hypothetical protein